MKATITKATIAVLAGLAILADAFLLFSMKISNGRHVNVIAIVTASTILRHRLKIKRSSHSECRRLCRTQI